MLAPWVKVGAVVAVISLQRHTLNDQATKTTITKIGKRDIVLADGRRFNVNDFWGDDAGGHYLKRGGTRDPGTYLYSIDHPKVQDLLAKQRRYHVTDAANLVLKSWRDTGDDQDLVSVIELLTAELPDSSS
jgi:hypothetical protein